MTSKLTPSGFTRTLQRMKATLNLRHAPVKLSYPKGASYADVDPETNRIRVNLGYQHPHRDELSIESVLV